MRLADKGNIVEHQLDKDTDRFRTDPLTRGLRFNQDIAFKLLYLKGLAYLNLQGGYDFADKRYDLYSSRRILPLEYDRVDDWLEYHLGQMTRTRKYTGQER